MTRPAPGSPDSLPPHPHQHDGQDSHPHQHGDDCPDHFDRCHVQLTGYMDCPKPHCEDNHFVTTMLTVGCATDNPAPQIAAHLAVAANAYDEVIEVLDLGHDGWLVIFKHPV